MNLNDLAYMGTQAYFEERILEIDVLAEVDFDSIPFGIRIRPSHPRYRDAIVVAANAYRCIGAACSVVREVDEFIQAPMMFERSPAPPKRKRRRFGEWVAMIFNRKMVVRK